jgi:sporadic carbohydrate cluster protein (TIGR04323 family)
MSKEWMLENVGKYWDNMTLNYNLEKYDLPGWALRTIQEKFPQVKELEKIHEVLTPPQVVELQLYVQNACSRKDFMELFDAFVAEYAPPRIDNKRYMIQRQGTLRVVIPNQTKSGRRLQFHQGVFVGNGRGIRTFWTPLTKAEKTNSVFFIDWDKSREITQKFLQEKWTLDKFEEVCLEAAWPVELVPGQSHLFWQEHMHGNINNDEGYTRVAIDMRILLEGEEYDRRLPGGFVRMPGDHIADQSFDYTGKHFITYAGWNSAYSKNIPLPMQRSVINQYCEKYKIEYSSYEFENEHADWQPALEHFIQKKPDGIVLTSMFSLTDDADRRDELLSLALENGVELHFANELCFLKTKDDLEKIKYCLNFGVPKKGKQSWEE